MRKFPLLIALLLVLLIALLLVSFPGPGGATPPKSRASAPISHIVVIFQENHSFDNVLGLLCVVDSRCDGATEGRVYQKQKPIPLAAATDIVPIVEHSVQGQRNSIDGGKMDGYSRLRGCGVATHYACYSQFAPSQIPNLAALARSFVVSDRTFEFRGTPSWVGHIALAAATTDGFTGNNPAVGPGPGWGCDSKKVAPWRGPSGRTLVPSCIPDKQGQGPFEPSPVRYVPTIFDTLDQSGLTWRLYTPPKKNGLNGYEWAICPTFYECLGGPQSRNMVDSTQVISDAETGSLPALSIVIPSHLNSQHNAYSMALGDNWIGKVVSEIEAGPDWATSAIFITYDDCGCFYDHVVPPGNLGIRVPMVIVSPQAKPGFTDSTNASYASILAFIEHTYGLKPLNQWDAAAYDYSNSFSFAQAPVAPIPMTTTAVPSWEQRWIAHHGETNDVT